ncbi:hypothetical protein WIV_gp006 [Wiseana iridescent virus]|uniref:Uncharacterized protein n=1 Tax=Wiseana iridescent virus TaxID=68347 RepID=G0T532_IRV9|nr:hypothetical protein WIV_gp006 [Wiseana iridescent virus]ADO00348.1 hypothetical protein [Wiseana iridescent virus]
MSSHKLTIEEHQTIIDLYNNGTTISYLSRQFKVSRPTIYTILNKVRNDHKEIDFYVDKLDENKDMDSNTNVTNFLGITIDNENGSNNRKINKALNSSFKLLDIIKFVEVTKFKINTLMFDYFWQVIVGNITYTPVSISVLEWFGYTGEYYKQRQNFKKMLKNNNIPYRELTQKDKEIELYPTIQEELQLIPTNVKHSKFLIMEPKDLKMAIMQLKTKNGHIIRKYYIDLEELLKAYTEYTLYFNHRESLRKITGLEQKMTEMTQYMRSLGISLEEVKDQNQELLGKTKGLKKQNKLIQRKLGIAVEDRAPQPEDESKRERFVLIKRNDPEYYPFYIIRAQEGYTKRKLKSEKNNFPNLEVLLDFKCSPNSKSLYTRIKENLKIKNVTFINNNIDLEDASMTEEELIEEMKVINESKREI